MLCLLIYLSMKLQEKFNSENFSLLELRRHIHHLTRLPDYVVRDIIEGLLDNRIVVLKKVNKTPVYAIDISEIELNLLKLSATRIKELQRRYRIQDE